MLSPPPTTSAIRIEPRLFSMEQLKASDLLLMSLEGIMLVLFSKELSLPRVQPKRSLALPMSGVTK